MGALELCPVFQADEDEVISRKGDDPWTHGDPWLKAQPKNDVGAMIRNLKKSLEVPAEEKHLHFNLEPPPGLPQAGSASTPMP